jgi:hypothetical protein
MSRMDRDRVFRKAEWVGLWKTREPSLNQRTKQPSFALFFRISFGDIHVCRFRKGLQEGPQEPIVDFISPSTQIVRVNLRPYIHSGGDPASLLEAFIKTANEFRGDPKDLRRYWFHAKQMVADGILAFEMSTMEAFFLRVEEEHFPAVHHSSLYEEVYHPAYRVVHLAYLSDQTPKHPGWSG